MLNHCFLGASNSARAGLSSLCLLAGLLASCAGPGQIGPVAGAGTAASSSIQVAQPGELPMPTVSDLVRRDRPYIIGPFDRLVIDVFGVEGLDDKEVQTDAGGRISFPLAGIIEAAGHTPGELEEIIRDRLRGRYIRDPQVTVNLKETVSQVVTVDGQVREPGLYPVVGRMTLMRAVATAKGVSEFAKLDDVVVFRTVGGKQMAALYNLKAIRRGTYDDPEIYANDIVVVGDSAARRFFKDALQVLPAVTTPLVILLTQ